MDNITHSLIGVVLARAGLARRFGPGTTLTLLIGSNLPDVDVVTFLFAGDRFFLHRRMLTHSVFGVPILAAACATILSLAHRGLSWRTFFGLALLAATLHVGLDLINPFGVCCLHPASSRRFELSWVFIIDVFMLALLAAPLLLAALFRNLRGPKPALSALLCVVIYIAVCGAARARSRRLLERVAEAGERIAGIFPEPFGPQRFRGVLRRGDLLRSYLVYPATGGAEFLYSVRTDEDSPRLRSLRATAEARELEWFFAVPVWRILPDGSSAEIHDLRFRSAVLGWQETPFTVRLALPGESSRASPAR